MPWSLDSLPNVAKNWSREEQERCIAAGNSALADGKSEQDAIFACVGAAGRGKGRKFWDAVLEVFGGPGSGHHGHKGIPGQRGGSAPKGGGISLVALPTVGHVLNDTWRTGDEQRREASYVIGSEGKILAVHFGDAERTLLDKDVAAQAYAIVHNHPRNVGFSDNDFITLRDSTAKHLFVVTPDKTVYRLSRTKNTDFSWYDEGRLSYEADKIMRKKGVEFESKSWVKARDEGQNAAVKLVAEKVGLEYSIQSLGDFEEASKKYDPRKAAGLNDVESSDSPLESFWARLADAVADVLEGVEGFGGQDNDTKDGTKD